MPRSQTTTPWTYLRAARLRAGHTPVTAAKALNITLGHYCNIESGERGPSDALLIRAAALFGVDVAELDRTKPQLPWRGRTDEPVAS